MYEFTTMLEADAPNVAYAYLQMACWRLLECIRSPLDRM